MASLFFRMRSALFVCLLIPQLCAPVAGWARTDVANICERAAQTASRESGVPLNVLRAISLTETGRAIAGSTRPWPWTVNMEGAGHWFDAPDEVLDYVRKEHARGARSFDLGCFQINYRWHGQAFRSFEHMLDPVENARYAARFLTELYGEFGDWTKAAGAYHSRTPKFARRYEARFDRFMARLTDQPPPTQRIRPETEPALARQPAILEPRLNHFPLLRTTSGTRGPGSLVPLSSTPELGRLIEPRG